MFSFLLNGSVQFQSIDKVLAVRKGTAARCADTPCCGNSETVSAPALIGKSRQGLRRFWQLYSSFHPGNRITADHSSKKPHYQM
jgi:hypothetical protein